MTRRNGAVFFRILLLTVPMLLVIGAVLSVFLFCVPAEKVPFPAFRTLLFVALSATLLALIACVAALFALRRYRLAAEARDRMRDRFLSDVAHELKTPLTVVRGSAEVLRDGMVPPEKTPEYCERILRESDAMARLVNDLLDVTRMKAGKISLFPRDVDLSFLASSVVDALTPLAESAGVTLRFQARDPLPVLLLDYDRVRQLLVIFTDNAIKHTPQGGSVTVTVGKENARTCFFSVSDTGCGIAPEDIPHIFDRFYQADSFRASGGSGIGLSVARQIVLLHEGTIDVNSRMGEGTCFTVYLPLREFKEEL